MQRTLLLLCVTATLLLTVAGERVHGRTMACGPAHWTAWTSFDIAPGKSKVTVTIGAVKSTTLVKFKAGFSNFADALALVEFFQREFKRGGKIRELHGKVVKVTNQKAPSRYRTVIETTLQRICGGR